ncbi:MAG: AAA family ATPase [Verrucomicrobiota bacterium]
MSDQFPFTAIVGMDLAKTSLLLHAVNPRLGGVLLSGHRGCAKTTLARAFADLLPDSPMCEVPLGASEDRLLGSVDVAAMLERNEWSHEKGLLEEAHGGVLYVDEVNLLPDDLSDQMLDAAATGSYRLEREGMSRRVESRFILVGTMNPEEGQLRPQLADRFAHSVSIASESGAEERSQIIEHRLRFEADPFRFRGDFSEVTEQLIRHIEEARELLSEVQLGDDSRNQIGARAEELGLEGMRTGLAVARTAIASAAWEGRTNVTETDLDLAWHLCLGEEETKENDPSSPPPRERGERDEPSSRSFVSMQPKAAQEDSIEQEAKREAVDDPLATWLLQPDADTEIRGVTSRSGKGSIRWRDTVMGWMRDNRRVRVRRRKTRRTRHLWVFLDASRSTGASGFLGKSLTLLTQSLGRSPFPLLRINLLQLCDGEIEWRVRGMVASEASRTLASSVSASGESRLPEALTAMLREMKRRNAGRNDLGIVFSDGIATASDREGADLARRQMQGTLFRISRLGPQLLWFAPEPRRGFLHPVDTLGLGSFCRAESI